MIHLGARSNASPFSRAPSPRSPRNNTALGNPRSPHGTQGKGKRKECHHCGLLLALRFTSPHGERPAPSSCIRPASPFQFTLPHGERRGIASSPGGGCKFQFTLPHGERQRATTRKRGVDAFQFTLPRGERLRGVGGFRRREQFQFTLPRGERRRARSCRDAEGNCFNSRSRVGSDRQPDAALLKERLFQFTLPRGERRGLPNSLSPLAGVSIHAPAWGATCGAKAPVLAFNVSIHAPAWGAT